KIIPATAAMADILMTLNVPPPYQGRQREQARQEPAGKEEGKVILLPSLAGHKRKTVASEVKRTAGDALGEGSVGGRIIVEKPNTEGGIVRVLGFHRDG